MVRRKLLPQPAVSVAIVATWLLAQNGVSVADLVLGAALGLLIPLFSATFWPGYPAGVRYGPLLRLAARVGVDILIANVRVAVLVLGPKGRLRPTFIELPLAVESDHAITLLASVISLTPGTVSANLSGDRRTLLVHGLAIPDARSEIARIQQRYETLVMEAFGC